jgi:hypothetical protein
VIAEGCPGDCRAEASNAEFNGDGEMDSYLWFYTTPIRETQMTKLKMLSAIAIISTAIATPVFAQDAIGRGYASQRVTPYDRIFRGAYNQSDAEFYAQPLSSKERMNIENFGFSGRDASRVGGEDPYLHPGG